MATTDDLRARIAKMTQQLQTLESKERGEALKTARDLVQRFNFEAAELGLKLGKRGPANKGQTPKVKTERPPMYREPKSGATWNGWGKAPQWMPKDKSKRVKFLINGSPAEADGQQGTAASANVQAVESKAPAKKAAGKKTAAKKAAAARKGAASKSSQAKKPGKRAASKTAGNKPSDPSPTDVPAAG